jgi:hypothetical protein
VFGPEAGRCLWVDRKRVASPSRQTGRASKLSVLSNAQQEEKFSHYEKFSRLSYAIPSRQKGKLGIGMLSTVRKFLIMRIVLRNFLTFFFRVRKW